MSYTIEQLLNINTKSFESLKLEQLVEIKETLMSEKKERTKTHIKPLMDQHVKPITDKIIKPVKKEFIAPIDKVLKDLKTYLPKPKPKQAFITFGGKRFGPLTKKEIIEMIVEVDDQKNNQ